MENVKYQIPPAEVLDTLGKYILVDGFHTVIDLVKSHDNYIVDAVTGQEILDCYSYFASLPIGHNHPKLFYDDFLKALFRATIANPSNSDIYCPEYAWAVKTFAEFAKPAEFKYMFFVAGGAPAIGNALKVAFDWRTRKEMNANFLPPKAGYGVLHLKEAFHGRLGYTLSLTNTDPVKTEYFPKFDWPRITNPKSRFGKDGRISNATSVQRAEREAMIQIDRAMRRQEIAALILEPIQGEGGDNHFRPCFFKALRQKCDDNDIMLIFDEVQTGVGLTGRMWAYEHFGVTPDILVFGKKTQVCGIMATERVDEVPDNVFRKSGRINSTWGANLADFLRGARYLEIICEDNLVANAATVGKYFLDKLRAEVYDPKHAQNIRGRGLMIAFDFKDAATRNEFRRKAWDNGLATLSCGTYSVRFRPPLTFTKENVDEAIRIIKKSL